MKFVTVEVIKATGASDFTLGLGEKQIARIEIQWFNGRLQVIENLPTNQTLTIIQPESDF